MQFLRNKISVRHPISLVTSLECGESNFLHNIANPGIVWPNKTYAKHHLNCMYNLVVLLEVVLLEVKTNEVVLCMISSILNNDLPACFNCEV